MATGSCPCSRASRPSVPAASPDFVALRLRSATISEGDIGARYPVERHAPERSDEHLIGRRVELGPADGADTGSGRGGYFFE
jgi:hypothetical protein